MFPDRGKKEKKKRKERGRKNGKKQKEKKGEAVDTISIRKAALTWEKFNSSFGGERKIKVSSWKTIGLEVCKLLTRIFCFFLINSPE